MTCPACGQYSPAGKRFCGDCGAALDQRCPQCGVDNPPAKNFCGDCGVALVQRSTGEVLKPPPALQADRRHGTAEIRKVISIVFADLMGSTALQERLDPESVNRVMDAYYQAVRGPVEAAGGTVVQLLGDGVLCAFGIPTIAEDDALRAVCAAIEIQRAFRQFLGAQAWISAPIGLRVAVNTGEVVVSDEHPAGIGDPLNVAARLQQEAHDGEVLIGSATRRLVADAVTLERAGVFALKGRAEAVVAYRVLSIERPTGVAPAPFVGRDEELARIKAVYDEAIDRPASRLAVLLGSPGLGKSRLIEEFVRRQGEAVCVLSAHCDAAGGATFAPVAEALREILGVEAGTSLDAVSTAIAATVPGLDSEGARVVPSIGALLAGSPAPPEETFFAIRRLLAALAAARPVVLVIDDLHWAEPLLLDLVEHLVQWGSGVPLLVLVGARPELRDLRSSLVSPGTLVSDVVTLGGLDAGAAMRLAANVIGAADLPAAVAAKVLATSEGNPLFVGELVRMLVDEGAIERQGERWIVGTNLAALEMPPTIHALLAARIERLAPEDRIVLERAAVVGRHFSRSAVAALLGHNGSSARSVPSGETSALNARLEALQRTELIERDTGWFLGEPMLRFHHVLIRDAAYRRLLKGTRAELHQQLAEWIEAQVKDAPEHDETIGWHLEQAHQHRRQLGPLDAQGRTLGARAASRLAAAGRRALARDDLPVAADLLGRAIDRLDGDDPGRADLALDWCEALLAVGDVAAAAKAIEELRRFVVPLLTKEGEANRLSAWYTCFTGQLTVLTAPQALHTTADAVAAAAEVLASLNDSAGEAKAHFVHALGLARLGRIGGCEAALDKALAAARRAGDRRRANTVLAIAPLAALWGPSPVTRASGRCLDVVRVLRITQGAPAVEAVALSCQAVLEALRGRTGAARRMIASARKMVEDLGITHRLLETDVFGALIDLLEGDAVAAERNLRRAYDGLRDLGLGIDAARAAALLARALLAQDRSAEAEALSHESETLAGDDLKAAIAWRGVRAEALARRGEPAAAVDLANEAVAIAASTDALLDHADARLALAAALRAAGRGNDAGAEERRAIELWEAKGATVLVERTRSETRGAATAAPPEPRTAPAPRRRVTPNRASAALVPFNAAMAAPDFAAFREQLSEVYEEIDHPTGVSYGRDANVTALQRLMRSRDASCQLEPLATLGDALVLSRRTIHASATGGGRFDVGEYEQEAYTIAELDDRGRWCRHEVFAANRLHEARVRLFERHAELLPDGPERTRAAAAARSLDIFRRAETDPDILVAALAPEFEGVDHRHLSSHSLHGAAAYIEHLRGWRQVAADLVFRESDILALEPRAVLVATLHTGTARSGGGAYERPFLTIFVLDSVGRLARAEWFDADRDAEALARFDELTSPTRPATKPLVLNGDPPSALRIEGFDNAASRADRELFERFNARDWPGIEALAAPDLVFDERRRMLHNTCGRDVWLEQFRVLYDVPASRFSTKLAATRGERLSLSLHQFAGEVAGGGGPVEMDDHLVLHEVDGEGRLVAIVLFDLDDQDAAHAELDARWAAGEGAAYPIHTAVMRAFGQAVATQDWEPVVALCAPTIIEYDHRGLAVLGTTRGAAAWVQNFRSLVDLAPGTAYRVDHFRSAARGFLCVGTWHGVRDGGHYEIPLTAVLEVDAHGQLTRADVYDDAQYVEARARFAAMGASSAASAAALAKPTAATVAIEHLYRSFDPHQDWDAVRAACSSRFRWEDRRAIVGMSGDVELMIASARARLASGARLERRELIGAAGDRVVITQHLWAGGPTDGRFEVEFLVVGEMGADGLCTALIFFDPDDLRVAQREAWGRWAAIDPTVAELTANLGDVIDAWNTKDLDRLRALIAEDLVAEDHRRTGIGRSEGREAYLRSVVALWKLAPESRLQGGLFWLAHAPHGGVYASRRSGTLPGGGEFVSDFLVVVVLERGLLTRLEVFEVDAADAALARFEELGVARRT